MSMVLLQSMNEADCLDHQHRRTGATTERHHTCRSAYRASGLVQRLTAAGRLRSSNVRSRLQRTLAAFTAENRFISKLPVDVVGQPNFRLAQQRTNALDPTQGVRSA